MADGYDKWMEHKEGKGWFVKEVGGGWSKVHGPYRWRWLAALVWLFE